MKRLFIALFVAVAFLKIGSVSADAQSDNYKLLKNLDLQYNILQVLSKDFVDTIKYDYVLSRGINAMLESLDPYTEFIPSEESESIDMLTTGSYGGIGAMIRKVDSVGVIISLPYKNSPASLYGLEPGDIILEIDGTDVKPLSADECSKRMRGVPGSTVVFKVKKGRSGEIKTIEITRDKVHTSDISYYGLLYNNDERTTDGYIDLSSFTVGGGEDFRRAVKELISEGAKRIIIDLRGNGGGVLEEAVDVVSTFVPQGSIVVKSLGRGEGTTFENVTTKAPVDTLIPVMVLVNSASASSSEIVAGALQDWDRAMIAGTRTYGKGLVQSFRDVGYGGRLKLTISKYYTPSGRCIQAMDYSHRNSDGSVASVPDSLKKPFNTLIKRRTVYDGGGIDPDTTIEGVAPSRTAVALLYAGILSDYAIEFYKKNPTIGDLRTFTLSEQQYSDFVDYAKELDIDMRSGAEIAFDQLVKRAQEEGLYDKDKDFFEALAKRVKLSKEEILKAQMKELKPVLEAEIAQRYGFVEGGILNGLKNDAQLWSAIEAWK